jgi:hypothetical protein
VAEFVSELQSFHVDHAWLVDHHPFWGVKSAGSGNSVKPLSAPLEAAWSEVQPTGIEMIVSGHVHMFAVIPFDSGRPTQLIAGDGGTELAVPVPASIDGTVIQGNSVHGSQTRAEFGYTWLRKTDAGWNLTLRSTEAFAIVKCAISNSQTACGDPGEK